MNHRQLFRQMGTISRQAMIKMNQKANAYDLDNNLFLILIRIVENPGLNQTQLAQLIQIDKTTLSRSLQKLEKKELIYKKTNLENKKFKDLFPSQEALKLYDILIGFEDSYIQSVLKQLSSTELAQLQTILEKINLLQ
ncbi:MAG: MarR family transcriptional regulator [Streptococcus sp.]|nr:MarR family transcriptional regulator [Streptococcus sp.]